MNVQTIDLPFDDLEALKAHILEIQTTWNTVGLLTDQDNKNTLLLLINDKSVSAVLRISFYPNDMVDAIVDIIGKDKSLFIGYYQGNTLNRDQITSINKLDEIWNSLGVAITGAERIDFQDLFTKIETNRFEKGRGDNIKVETKRQVMCFSHGRCMFEGCGKDLGFDDLTGTEGNFSYLAHNIGSSETATRGGRTISGLVSDDSKNILLMCDIHHRLIDTVAAADFSVARLSMMRMKFKEISNRLLNGLKFSEIPIFSVIWPIGGNVIDTPTYTEISQCLSVINTRAEGLLNVLSDNNDILLSINIDKLWEMMPEQIDNIGNKILQQTHSSNHNGGIFAIGYSPQLIGLGAKIGNKTGIVPMLRLREGGWTWPLDKPRVEVYTVIKDIKNLENEEIIVSVELTDSPNNIKSFVDESKMDNIKIIANDSFKGNDCIAHPNEGVKLMNDFHNLLHELKNSGIKKIHLLTCASNTACVYLGMAIDNFHPEVVIYDFSSDSMLPRLVLTHDTQGIKISSY